MTIMRKTVKTVWQQMMKNLSKSVPKANSFVTYSDMPKLLLVFITMAVYFGWVTIAAPLVSANQLLNLFQVNSPKQIIPEDRTPTALVLKFSIDVEKFSALANSEIAVTENQLHIHRDMIKGSFVEAYNSLEKIERRGDIVITQKAREQMQNVIGNYMLSPGADKYPIVTKDLDTYSSFMTNVLIYRTVASGN